MSEADSRTDKGIVTLGPGAEENGFANMLSELLRQNMQAKPHKLRDLRKMNNTAALVADDAAVAVTLQFSRGHVTIQSGVRGVPDVTIRGTTDAVMSMSNMPLTFGLPFPHPRDEEAKVVYRGVMDAMKKGEIHVYGMLSHFAFVQRLTRVMSVNG
jgi:hypothetical protein